MALSSSPSSERTSTASHHPKLRFDQRFPMTARCWVRNLFARTPRTARQAEPRRPRLEALGDRPVPAAYHVTSLGDDGSAGTLRDAITQADANPGPDTPP